MDSIDVIFALAIILLTSVMLYYFISLILNKLLKYVNVNLVSVLEYLKESIDVRLSGGSISKYIQYIDKFDISFNKPNIGLVFGICNVNNTTDLPGLIIFIKVRITLKLTGVVYNINAEINNTNRSNIYCDSKHFHWNKLYNLKNIDPTYRLRKVLEDFIISFNSNQLEHFDLIELEIL